MLKRFYFCLDKAKNEYKTDSLFPSEIFWTIKIWKQIINDLNIFLCNFFKNGSVKNQMQQNIYLIENKSFLLYLSISSNWPAIDSEKNANTRIKLNFLEKISKFWELQNKSVKFSYVKK
ncbi:hypothetical protein BpHYR1_005403 [Brachionus plicatilis]|uniref:Uncharacterized protein n=1 Tax=Brachionus plicatilis TaxID=10195 RepID=A0A3M7QHB8_BRAPC|nr:hypothetical protein BpHYR1_005403 [Brachionus plicatilis]